jgi:hypothetical protein
MLNLIVALIGFVMAPLNWFLFPNIPPKIRYKTTAIILAMSLINIVTFIIIYL